MTGQRVAGASTMVAHFSQEEQSTLATLQNLARQTHRVMGVSGMWIGSDDKQITVKEQNASLGEVLDDICRADPRFSWTRASDGSIQIRLRSEHLGLLDVTAMPSADQPPVGRARPPYWMGGLADTRGFLRPPPGESRFNPAGIFGGASGVSRMRSSPLPRAEIKQVCKIHLCRPRTGRI
jgi:hypothetical protein